MSSISPAGHPWNVESVIWSDSRVVTRMTSKMPVPRYAPKKSVSFFRAFSSWAI